ncbi:YdcH family protein [Aquibium microcysteis]|uniref:YdcH family protein n=1 Tax=Aquibium microcysteis TaxID=675281 RepID=UPI00165CEDC4|nr:DUF465 domain-containing protein [Aquibium microcysteis]
MSLTSHIEELKRKHSQLDREIAEAIARPSTDDIEVRQLKRRKLALKDAIEKLGSHRTTH